VRTIDYNAWIEDTNGNAIDEKALKIAIRSPHEDAQPRKPDHFRFGAFPVFNMEAPEGRFYVFFATSGNRRRLFRSRLQIL
jgi:hypothetical protein